MVLRSNWDPSLYSVHEQMQALAEAVSPCHDTGNQCLQSRRQTKVELTVPEWYKILSQPH